MITDSLRKDVLELAMDFTSDLDEAEDVTQVVLLKVHSSIHTFRGDSTFAMWLFRVTKNVVLECRRLAIRRARLPSAAIVDPQAFRPLLLRIERPWFRARWIFFCADRLNACRAGNERCSH